MDVSLKLFSQRGYAGSSVRDIAAKVGIKDSSLYFHYKNKQAILDSLAQRFIDISNQTMVHLVAAWDKILSMNDDLFCSITVEYVKSYLMDPFIRKFIQVLHHEQGCNDRLRALYVDWCIEKQLALQAKLLGKLQEIGYLKQENLEAMTVSFYSPVFLYFHQYMNGTLVSTAEQSFLTATIGAARNFLRFFKA